MYLGRAAILAVIVGCFLVSAAAPEGQSLYSENRLANWSNNVSLSPSYCQGMADRLSALTEGLEVPAHLIEGDAVRIGEDFDVNRYFTVLDQLSMESGYVLDYVYYNGGIGGEPVLYARKEDQPSYRDCNEFYAARESAGRPVDSPSHEEEYLHHIKANATPEGFFQLYLLRIMAGQFYLFWHANYDDYKVVCNSSDAYLYVSDPLLAENASWMDFAPRVEINDDAARVSAVVFTKWGGFIRRSAVFSTGFPHQILREDSQVLVPYRWGVVF